MEEVQTGSHAPMILCSQHSFLPPAMEQRSATEQLEPLVFDYESMNDLGVAAFRFCFRPGSKFHSFGLLRCAVNVTMEQL